MNRMFLLLGTLALFSAPPALAASWPERPVRIIIPWPPGGSTDIVGRLVAAELTSRLKQQVIIDPRPGAATVLQREPAVRLGSSFALT